MDEANGPIAEQVQSVCHNTLQWPISFSLDRRARLHERSSSHCETSLLRTPTCSAATEMSRHLWCASS